MLWEYAIWERQMKKLRQINILKSYFFYSLEKNSTMDRLTSVNIKNNNSLGACKKQRKMTFNKNSKKSKYLLLR